MAIIYREILLIIMASTLFIITIIMEQTIEIILTRLDGGHNLSLIDISSDYPLF